MSLVVVVEVAAVAAAVVVLPLLPLPLDDVIVDVSPLTTFSELNFFVGGETPVLLCCCSDLLEGEE